MVKTATCFRYMLFEIFINIIFKQRSGCWWLMFVADWPEAAAVNTSCCPEGLVTVCVHYNHPRQCHVYNCSCLHCHAGHTHDEHFIENQTYVALLPVFVSYVCVVIIIIKAIGHCSFLLKMLLSNKGISEYGLLNLTQDVYKFCHSIANKFYINLKWCDYLQCYAWYTANYLHYHPTRNYLLTWECYFEVLCDAIYASLRNT